MVFNIAKKYEVKIEKLIHRFVIPHNSMYNCPMQSKELLKGTLSAIILNLLTEHKRMYGYEISQMVKVRSDDKILLKDGSLYPALQKMTKDGLLTFEEEYIGKRVRKYYSLTKKGKAEKLVYMEELRDFIETLNKLVFNETKFA